MKPKVLHEKVFTCKWMAILNLSTDSFSADGLNRDSLSKRLEELEKTEASVIDFGAVSTKPGSPEVDFKSEWARLEPFLDDLLHFKKKALLRGKKIELSLDSSSPRIAAAVCERIPLDYINDIYAGQKVESGLTTFDVASQCNTAMVVMHMQNTPINMQVNPKYANCVTEVTDFLCKRTAAAMNKNVRNVMIDPGIGFGKSLDNNLELLQEASLNYLQDELLNRFGTAFPLLIGLSRKRFILELELRKLPKDPERLSFLERPVNRDLESKMWEYKCIEWGTQMIRTHKMPCEVEHGT